MPQSTDPQRVSLLKVFDLPIVPPPTTPRCPRVDLFDPGQTVLLNGILGFARP